MARSIGLLPAGERPPVRQENNTCPHCGRVYKRAAALKAHVTRTHPQVFADTD